MFLPCDFYWFRVWSLSTQVSDWLTHWLMLWKLDWCNSGYEVADVDAKKCFNDSLVESWCLVEILNLNICHNIKGEVFSSFRRKFFVKTLKLNFGQDLKLKFFRHFVTEFRSRFWSRVWSRFCSWSLVEILEFWYYLKAKLLLWKKSTLGSVLPLVMFLSQRIVWPRKRFTHSVMLWRLIWFDSGQ